jgi:uncharacterized protein (DUF58 family)
VEGERAGLRYALAEPRSAPINHAGATLGRRAGSSLEFNDYREYEPGDDLRHIDWNAYARSDQLSVKLFREEVTPHVDLVMDGSRSMALENSAKAQATVALAALFAAAASNTGFSHTAWLAAEAVSPVANGAARPVRWEAIDFAFQGNVDESLTHRAPRWRPRGIRVLLSDLLWLGDPLQVLRHFAERAAATVIVQVLAESDVEPPDQGNLRLVDAESETTHDVFVDAALIRRYRDALSRHQQNWQRACRQTGAVWSSVVAERVLGDWKLDELQAAEVLRPA